MATLDQADAETRRSAKSRPSWARPYLRAGTSGLAPTDVPAPAAPFLPGARLGLHVVNVSRIGCADALREERAEQAEAIMRLAAVVLELAELDPPDLARQCLWQIVDELDLTRVRVR